jgi:hypothetical protein
MPRPEITIEPLGVLNFSGYNYIYQVALNGVIIRNFDTEWGAKSFVRLLSDALGIESPIVTGVDS